jgi:hypothetical protein
MQRKTSAWIFQRLNSLSEFGQTCLSPSFATLASLAVQLFFQVETFSIPATARQLGRTGDSAVVSVTHCPSTPILSAPAHHVDDAGFPCQNKHAKQGLPG